MDPPIRWLLVAHGRVQGVGYRARVAEAAGRFGLVGSATNRSDGTVLLDVHGPAAALEAFVRDVSGPRGLSHPLGVTRIAEVPPVPLARGFSVGRA
ncbi:MAG TPA: acylphosphatase [Thermoplasmata archaeon]|nr:acylphosphatase [Thermoplasmata archaeon]